MSLKSFDKNVKAALLSFVTGPFILWDSTTSNAVFCPVLHPILTQALRSTTTLSEDLLIWLQVILSFDLLSQPFISFPPPHEKDFCTFCAFSLYLLVQFQVVIHFSWYPSSFLLFSWWNSAKGHSTWLLLPTVFLPKSFPRSFPLSAWWNPSK